MIDKLAYQKIWRKKNSDKLKKYNREKYLRDKENNPDRIIRRRIKSKEWNIKNKEKYSLYRKNWSKAKLNDIKENIFEKLGHVCKRCGFSDKRALCIDHVNGGGYKELKKLTVFQYYKKVLEDKTNSYQILCHNCNWIKRSENNEVRKAII